MIKKILEEHQTPFYVYDESVIKSKIKFLENLDFSFKKDFFFAVKSNSNLAIINFLKKNDIGAVTVSAGELYKALRSGIDPSKIIMNGSSKNIFDIKYAVTQKIKSINIENLEEISLINEYSKEKNIITDIGVRINPGIDANTFAKISTGKSGDKFGIEIKQINFDIIKQLNNINLNTLSVHIGSQIHDSEKLIESYKTLIDLADQLNNDGFNIQCLDFGGGFAVPDNNINTLNFDTLTLELNNIMKNKKYEIIFEPGRFLIAESGSLVSKVNYIKKSGNKNIVLIDASFSEYIRPALYGISPMIEVHNIEKNNKKVIYDIAGGVCESSDFFARDLELNEIKVGDYLIFKNTGAYGSSMSSTYNSRPRPLEILINNDEFRVIRSRDTLEDLCKNEIM